MQDDQLPYFKKLWYRINPCDIDRDPRLKPVGDALAKLVTHCPCCTGARIVLAGIVGFIAGAIIL